MHVSVLADIPGRSIATISTYMAKLECFDENRTRGKGNFENELLEMVFQLLEETTLEKLWYSKIG